ncbi:MAG TPA: dTMP kinase [Syntrophomonadaceae bacterium]|nr:dTMP kinase [Syntrophomonadaceae bacterium]
MNQNALFISLEGIDGAGKSSLKDHLVNYLKDVKVVCVREPGGTDISEKIRDLLLDVRNEEILPKTEAMLYATARSQLVEEVIRPALMAGNVVIADRYIDSTIAYQGYARGLEIKFLQELNDLSTSGLKPDLTLLLDLDPVIGQKRKQLGIPDRLEKEGLLFQAKVRKGYLNIAKEDPNRVKVLDASLSSEEVASNAIKVVAEFLKIGVKNED